MAIYNREDPRTVLPQLEKKLTVDYIVEQGKRGAWEYRKWDSGTIECWGSFSKSDLTWDTFSSTGLYYSSSWEIELPLKMKYVRVFATCREAGTNIGWCVNTYFESPNKIKTRIVRNGNTGSCGILVYVKGLWK